MKSGKLLFLLPVILLVTNNLNAQKKSSDFVGNISYSVTTQEDVDATIAAQLPTEIIMYYNGPKTRIEQKTSMGSAIILSNADTKEQTVLIDMMGQKMALKSTKEETENSIAQMPKADVVVGTETKTIAGYTCKKVDFTQDGKTSTIWVTEDIKLNNANWQTPYKDVNGVMLEYTQISGQEGEISMLITAKEVKKGKVKDAMFTVPTGYQEMSITEFRKMMGGGAE
ncbi:MAG: hypothetical protein A2X08_14065 [Bacteroidetes bacterium GWA2_32_17]|nr:MAG: hypothetical protein A2X08_14065 [Bacteroidetes bacterium GWA2_32_17]